MLKFYLAKYKEWHKDLKKQYNEKKSIIFWCLLILFILSFIILVISIYGIFKKTHQSFFKYGFGISSIANLLSLIILSIVDNKWQIKKAFINFSSCLLYCKDLKKQMKEYFCVENKKQYEKILYCIKKEKEDLLFEINKPLKKINSFLSVVVLGLAIGVAPAVIQGLMDNNTDNAKEIAATIGGLFIVAITISLIILASIYWYSLSLKTKVRLCEDFESDIQVIIDDMNDYYENLNTCENLKVTNN